MSDGTRPEPRCIDCGGRWLTLDNEGLCQACFVARGLRRMAAQLDQEREAAMRNLRY